MSNDVKVARALGKYFLKLFAIFVAMWVPAIIGELGWGRGVRCWGWYGVVWDGVGRDGVGWDGMGLGGVRCCEAG